MEDILYVKGIHQLFFATKKLEDKNDDEWRLLHMQMCGLIWQWIDDNVYNHIIDEYNAQALWLKLDKLYASKSRNNKMYLINQLLGLKYKEDASLMDHMNNFLGMTSFDEATHLLGLILLSSLLSSWETFQMSFFNSSAEGSMSMNSTKDVVLNEDAKRKV